MENLTPQIHDFLQSDRKPADKITSFLKWFGDGNMNLGLKRAIELSYSTGKEQGITIGEKRGIIKGVGGTLGSVTFITTLYLLIKQIKKEAKSKAEVVENEKMDLTKDEFSDDNDNMFPNSQN